MLADAAGRQHYLDWGDWRSFFDACGDDPVIDEIERLLELLDPSLFIVLLTGRPRRVQPHTLAWLERYGIRWDLLIMREFGDYSGVDEFKRESLRELRAGGFSISNSPWTTTRRITPCTSAKACLVSTSILAITYRFGYPRRL